MSNRDNKDYLAWPEPEGELKALKDELRELGAMYEAEEATNANKQVLRIMALTTLLDFIEEQIELRRRDDTSHYPVLRDLLEDLYSLEYGAQPELLLPKRGKDGGSVARLSFVERDRRARLIGVVYYLMRDLKLKRHEAIKWVSERTEKHFEEGYPEGKLLEIYKDKSWKQVSLPLPDSMSRTLKDRAENEYSGIIKFRDNHENGQDFKDNVYGSLEAFIRQVR